MRGSLGFPGRSYPAEPLKALPPSLFCQASAISPRSTYPAIVGRFLRWMLNRHNLLMIITLVSAVDKLLCFPQGTILSERIGVYLFG
jgi:hypothetical protein